MCGTPPKLHAPDAQGSALWGQRLVRSEIRVTSSVAAFKQWKMPPAGTIAAYTMQGGRCKACEKKLQM